MADGDIIAEADDDGAADIAVDQVVFDQSGGAVGSGSGAFERVAEIVELNADTDPEIGAAALGADDAVVFEGFIAANNDMKSGRLIEGHGLVERDAARLGEILIAVAVEPVALNGEIVERKGTDSVARAVMDIIAQDAHTITGNDDPVAAAIRDVEAGEGEVGAKDANLPHDFGGTARDRTKGDRGALGTGAKQ